MMRSVKEFKPDWFSPPGDTIRHLIDEKGLTVREFSKQLNFSPEFTEGLLAGHVALSRDIAQELTCVFGGSQNFWLAREREYREDLERFIKTEGERWVQRLPYKDMVRFGWVAASRKLQERIANCMDFFGVSSVDEWHKNYERQVALTAFKMSEAFESTPESMLSWLRQGEIVSKKMNCPAWDRNKFLKVLPEARALTRVKDPNEFIPKLQSLFSECGVAVVVLPTPTGCPASGAVFPAGDSATILLSFRYLSDDQFWFTLFHEVGHLLLHGADRLLVEGASSLDRQEEDEANEFSKNLLVPPEFQDEMSLLTAKDWKKILRFAKKIGVSPGIVVGQLQHLKIVRYDYLNRLKVRYKWSSLSLE